MMVFRPSVRDLSTIGFYTGQVLSAVGAAMVIPAVFAIVLGEENEAWGFVIGASLALIVGRGLVWAGRSRGPLTGMQGLVVVGCCWLAAPVLGAVPLLLSGHYASYLDAYYEAMSGFATIGQTMAQDLDHMARSVNLWRHLMQFTGGQGIIIVMLSLLSTGSGAIGSLYTAEGREEKILPNVVNTARFIWRVTMVYAAVGIVALWIAVQQAGMEPGLGLYHAVNLFMAAFDTGGFSVQSTSVGFYRSAVVEGVLLPIMVAGGFSFALHFWLWHRVRGELWRNLEARVMAVSLLGLFTLLVIGMVRSGAFTDATATLRHGVFHAVSAHTTTGLATVPGTLYVSDWGELAPAAIVIGMAMGGMAGSTAGGIKVQRIGLLLKTLRSDMRRMLLPSNALVTEYYHAGRRRLLTDAQSRWAVIMFLLWLLLYGAGALMGLFYGYDLRLALFDSTAAGSSGGLSVGVARPGMETLLKVVYIAQMVLGRLEFIALFVLAGYLVSLFRGRT